MDQSAPSPPLRDAVPAGLVTRAVSPPVIIYPLLAPGATSWLPWVGLGWIVLVLGGVMLRHECSRASSACC